jgi:hypothetical protein
MNRITGYRIGATVYRPDEVTVIHEQADDIRSGERSFVVWDGAIWHRDRREGGYQTISPPLRRLPCDTLAREVNAAGTHVA